MFQLMPRGYLRLATMVVCLGVSLGLTNELLQSASPFGESESSDNELPIVSVSPADGATYPAGATIPFSVTAWDADGTIEAVAFYVNEVWYATQYSEPYEVSLPNVATGAYVLTAVVWDSARESTTTSHRLTVGSSDSANQPPSIIVSSPERGTNYPGGAAIPFAATAWDNDGTIAAVEFYVDSVLYATQYYGPYGIWLPDVAPGVHTLTAVARDNEGASGSASLTLTVGSSGGGGNQSPSVSVTSPASGASYPVGATIPFSATASDADAVARIELYVDSVWHATAYSSSHSISLPNVAAGVYTLTASAWDNTGASSTSDGIIVIVGASSPPPLAPSESNQPPIVSLTAPASGATFTSPATITVSATASDVDGAIAQVEFYANGSLIRTDTSGPYSFSWTNVIAGDYSLTAVARDNAGATTVSSTRDISVRPANLPSTAVFVPSSNHATAVDRYVLEVFPVGADPTVANPVATRDLGKPAIANGECRADISSTILALTPGTYIATVTAMGSGGSAQSAPSPQFTR